MSRRSWPDGYYDRMPLPDLGPHEFCVALLDHLGRAVTKDLVGAFRLACLSEFGINVLQQRLTLQLTRAAIPTYQFNQAFAHTLVEADLLEDWTDTLTEAGRSTQKAIELFEEFIRRNDPSLQAQLLDVERRASVRAACIREARAILKR